jgi:hypothetical protein
MGCALVRLGAPSYIQEFLFLDHSLAKLLSLQIHHCRLATWSGDHLNVASHGLKSVGLLEFAVKNEMSMITGIKRMGGGGGDGVGVGVASQTKIRALPKRAWRRGGVRCLGLTCLTTPPQPITVQDTPIAIPDPRISSCSNAPASRLPFHLQSRTACRTPGRHRLSRPFGSRTCWSSCELPIADRCLHLGHSV